MTTNQQILLYIGSNKNFCGRVNDCNDKFVKLKVIEIINRIKRPKSNDIIYPFQINRYTNLDIYIYIYISQQFSPTWSWR